MHGTCTTRTTRLLTGTALAGAVIFTVCIPATTGRAAASGGHPRSATHAQHEAHRPALHPLPRTTPPAALPVSIGTAVAYVHGPDGGAVTVPPTSLPTGAALR